MIAEVAFPIPDPCRYDYLVPPHLTGKIKPGLRVWVSFGRKEQAGFIIALKEKSEYPKLKSIQSCIDQEPVFDLQQFTFLKWMSEYYQASIGETLSAAYPAHLKLTTKIWVERLRQPSAPEKLNHPLLAQFHEKPFIEQSKLINPYSSEEIFKEEFNRLVAEGWIRIENRPVPRGIHLTHVEMWVLNPDFDLVETKSRSKAIQALLNHMEAYPLDWTAGQPADQIKPQFNLNRTHVKWLLEKQVITIEWRKPSQRDLLAPLPYQLNEEQASAYQIIEKAINSGHHQTILLNGVTGSGKTLVYLAALSKVLAEGKSALLLVPEISLTPQMINRFTDAFGDVVGAVHSKLNETERFQIWHQLLDGHVRLLIGPRSALLAPLKTPGIIIVDEEHEASYKQVEPNPRYQARESAIYRGWLSQCTVLLGSATPSMESSLAVEQKKFGFTQLTRRFGGQSMPEIRLIPMGIEREQSFFEGPVSPTLQKAIQSRLVRGESVILLQNRRGFSSYMECSNCGWVHECPDCSISLTRHLISKNMRCHYCGYSSRMPDQCPVCQSSVLLSVGFGTQQTEEYLKKWYPETTIIRMDADSVSGKTSHEQLLANFGKKSGAILLGTQMIAKGLDFPSVTLVGVINADTTLLMPDFRSSERAFQLLSQVSGRSGRGVNKGEVLIQTYHPDHPVFRFVINHDYDGFFQWHIRERKELGYPPFTRMVLFEIKSKMAHLAEEVAEMIVVLIRSHYAENQIKGPSEPSIERVAKWYRQQIRLLIPRDSRAIKKLIPVVLECRQLVAKGKGRNARLIVDVDPL